MYQKWIAIPLIVVAALSTLAARSGRGPAPAVRAGGELPRSVDGDPAAWVLEPQNPPMVVVPVRDRARRAGAPGRAADAGPSVANRNRNPLNIKLGSITRRYVDLGHATISDIEPLDGGRFLKFASAATGFRAALDLLKSGPYGDLDLAQAFERWSNRGFGTEILAGTALDGRTRVSQLGRDDLTLLLNAMAVAEGYRSATIADEIVKALRP